jgi:hypothetical protein
MTIFANKIWRWYRWCSNNRNTSSASCVCGTSDNTSGTAGTYSTSGTSGITSDNTSGASGTNSTIGASGTNSTSGASGTNSTSKTSSDGSGANGFDGASVAEAHHARFARHDPCPHSKYTMTSGAAFAVKVGMKRPEPSKRVAGLANKVWRWRRRWHSTSSGGPDNRPARRPN